MAPLGNRDVEEEEEEGDLILDTCAHASNAIPAGIKRHDAKNKGVVCGPSCFIATIEVPQKKKGDTTRRVSNNDDGVGCVVVSTGDDEEDGCWYCVGLLSSCG
jgi:hypothetical protein